MAIYFFRIFSLLVLLTLFRSSPALAQILQTDIISSFRKSDTSAALIGLFQFGFSVQQQLNTVFELGAGADLQYNFDGDALVLASKAKRTYAGDIRVTNSGYGHLRYLFRRTERVGFDAFSQYQWDGPRGMKNRYLLGANLRVIVLRDSVSSVDAAAGLMYERERWDYAGVEPLERQGNQSPLRVDHPRINTYIRYYRKITPGVDLLLMNYIQSRTDRHFTEPRIATAVQIDIHISDRFTFSVNYNSIYDMAPIVPIRKFYFDISNNLKFRI